MALRVRIHDLPNTHALEHAGVLEPEELPRLREEGGQVLEPLHFETQLKRDQETVYFRGTLQGRVELSCSLCLEPVPCEVDESFGLILLPEHEQKHLAPELVVSEATVDTDYYTSDELDLGDLLEEQVLLALPLKPVCQEDCHGLCPGCGANLNREACTCPEPDLSDSPFAALLPKRPS